VLLSTGDRFDVVDVPAHIGALARDALLGPVAVTPVGRWMFFVRPGVPLRPELACLSDVVLHSEGSWVAVPPVRSPSGRVRWIVTPSESKWRVPNAERVQAMLVETLPRLQPPAPWLRRAA
jgi:Bifunctional DNA primase/polymerase, N-terminal